MDVLVNGNVSSCAEWIDSIQTISDLGAHVKPNGSDCQSVKASLIEPTGLVLTTAEFVFDSKGNIIAALPQESV